MAREVSIKARKRSTSETGSSASRRLRRAGEIPATMYGRGSEPASVIVPARELSKALSGEAGLNVMLNLEFGEGETRLALARALQRDHIRDGIVHLDLMLVSRTEKVSAEVPVHLIGEAIGVREGGGVIDHSLHTVAVSALPANIPSSIDIDIESLAIGDGLIVGDLKAPEGVEITAEPGTKVVTVLAPSLATEEEEVAKAEAEAAEAEAAEAGEQEKTEEA